jgi:very-short-patch-repair endonuclease
VGGGGGGLGGLGAMLGGGGGGGGEPPIAPGGDMGAPSEPVGGGVGGPPISKASSVTAEVADPGQFGGKILKQKTRAKFLSDQMRQQRHETKTSEISYEKGTDGQIRDEKGRIAFTGAERKLIGPLKQAQNDGLLGNLVIVPQYRVQANGEEYVIDFAFPQLKVAVEVDGEIFHTAPKQKAKDQERDKLLAQQGWTTVRFWDTDVDKRMPQVIQKIVKTVMQKQMYLQNQVAQAEKNQDNSPANS